MKPKPTLLISVLTLLAVERKRVALVGSALWLAALALGAAVTGAMLFVSGWAVLVVVPVVAWLGMRWVRGARVRCVAEDLEILNPALRGRVVSALELGDWRSDGRERYSSDLLTAALSEVDAAVKGVELRPLVSRLPVRSGLVVLLVAVAGVLVCRAVAPSRLKIGAVNLIGQASRVARIEVLSRDTSVARGARVVLSCRVEPAGVFRRVRLLVKGARGLSRVVRMGSDRCDVALPAEAEFSYEFSVLGLSSERRHVGITEPLVFRRLRFDYEYPAYTGLASFSSSSPDIRALRGTLVRVSGTVTRRVATAQIRVGADSSALAVDEFGTGVVGSFRVASDASGAISLSDGSSTSDAAVLRVHTVADEPPFVRVLLPGRDIDMPASMRLPLVVDVLDDFGVGSVHLRFGRDSLKSRSLLRQAAGGREDTVEYTWDLSSVDMLPGEVMRYRVEALDNDVVSGPKLGISETYSVRFPTMAEIYTTSVRQAENAQQRLAPLQSEQEQIATELDRASDALDRNRELSWDERQALAGALSSQEGLMQQVADLEQEVQNLMQELGEGMAFDGETMERLGQLQQLLSQVLPRDLQRALGELRNRLESGSPDVRRAVDRLQLEQERLKAGIDRALDLLKRIVEEQQLDELARKADELATGQEGLTQRLEMRETDRVAEAQAGLTAGLDSLQARMRDLAESLSDSTLGDSLESLLDEMARDGLSRQAGELSEQLRGGRPGDGTQESRSLARGMRNAAERLQSLSQQLKQKRSADMAGRLAGLARDVLMLSGQQEELEQSAGAPEGMARRLSGLSEGARMVAESLASLAGRSMAVSPRLGQEMAGAVNAMAAAGRALNEGQVGVARPQMGQARVALNNVARALMDALGQAMQGGGMSGEMESLMDQLSQMAGEQMGINAEAGGLPIPIPGGMSPSQMQALQRVLSRQSAVRQQLQQMLQTMGASQPGLMASLEQVLEEMSAVERDMSELNITRELVERQQSILSHLLDAQRSLRQRGQKEERESESARPFEVRTRPQLPDDRGERDRMLREELLRALKQGYPGEYEPLIRAYFERLLYQ